MASDPADVIVLTGCLGAGKTTILNRLIAGAGARRIAVLVNDVAAEGIDDGFLLDGAQSLTAISGGCVCCSLDGDLARALWSLAARRDTFDCLVIELTGLADPAPVLRALTADAALRAAFRFAGVVTLVDARHVHQQLATLPQASQQIACADLLIVNKTDRVGERYLASLDVALDEVNSHAARRYARHADIDLDAVFDVARSPLAGFSCDAPSVDHSRAVQTLSLVVDAPLDALKLGAWLGTLPSDILRIKGILALWGDDDQFWFQGVRGDVDCRPGRAWRPDETRRSRLVVIGTSLDAAALRAGFAMCIARGNAAGSRDRFGRWHETIAPQRLDQIRFWMRQFFGFAADVPILIKEVPCAKPGCPEIETAIIALEARTPPRLFKVQASINTLTYDQIYDLMDNPMMCC